MKKGSINKILVLFLISAICFSMGGCSQILGALLADEMQLAAEYKDEQDDSDTKKEKESKDEDSKKKASKDEASEDEDSKDEDSKDEDSKKKASKDEASEDEDSEKKKAKDDGTLSDDIYSFSFAINDEIIHLPVYCAEFTDDGWELLEKDEILDGHRRMVSNRWEKNGVRILTDITNFSDIGISIKDCLVTGVNIELSLLGDDSAKVELPGGIVLGSSTQDDILETYGTPSDILEMETFYYATYSLDYDRMVKLKVRNETGILESFEIRNEIEPEDSEYAPGADL